MTLIVGSAATTYDLDLRPFRQSIAAGRRELAQFQRDMAALGARAAALPAPGIGAGAAAAAPNSGAARQAAEAARQEAAAARAVADRQQAEAKLAETLAKAARADQQRQTEAARTTAAQENAAAAASRRRQAEERERRQQENGGRGPALPRTFAGFTAGAIGQLGLGIGGAQLIAGGIDAGRRAIQLQQTINLTKELAGSQDQYNLVVAAAREQQARYGGSLQENIQGLSGLIITARSSGAALEELIGLSQRLALLDPSQGAEGARIAIAEALSGDPRSLALRYEIPRAALEKIKDESLSTSERLAVLDQYLNKIGITAGVVNSSITDQARAYNGLNAQIDALTTSTGARLADALDEAATGLGRLLGLVNENPQAIAELRAILSGQPPDVARAEADVARAQAERQLGRGTAASGLDLSGVVANRLGGEAVRQDAVDRSAALIQAGLGDQVAALNGAGLAAEEYQRRLRGLEIQAGLFASQSDALAAVGAAGVKMAGDLSIGQGEAALLQGRLEALAGTSDTNRLAVIALSNGYRDNQISGAELAQSVGALEAAQRQQEAAAKSATAAATGLTAEQRKQTLEQLDAAQGARQLADAQSTIASIGQQVANGILTVAQAAEYLATRYGYAADEADRLAKEAARAAQEAKADVALADQRAGERGGGSTQEERLRANALRIQQEQERARQEALLRQREAQATAAGLVAIREQQVAEAVARFGKGSAEAIDAETDLIEARQRAAKEAEKGAGSLGKAANQTARTLGQIEDRTEDHYRKLQQLQEDYQTRARRSEEDFQLRRSRSQEDFERERQRLLAEGKIAEARELEAEFKRQQARENQDQARQRQRAAEDLAQQQQRQALDAGIDTGRIVDRAALRGVNVPGGAQAAAGALPPTGAQQAAGAIAPTVAGVAAAAPAAGVRAQTVPLQLSVQIAPTQVQIDGQRIVELTWPTIAQLVDVELAADLATMGLVSPPAGGQQGGVGGPRP